jgi:hypothetical protein
VINLSGLCSKVPIEEIALSMKQLQVLHFLCVLHTLGCL